MAFNGRVKILTDKEKEILLKIANGSPASTAYREVYGVKDKKKSYAKASVLLKSKEARAYLESLGAKVFQKTEVRKEDIYDLLGEIMNARYEHFYDPVTKNLLEKVNLESRAIESITFNYAANKHTIKLRDPMAAANALAKLKGWIKGEDSAAETKIVINTGAKRTYDKSGTKSRKEIEQEGINLLSNPKTEKEKEEWDRLKESGG